MKIVVASENPVKIKATDSGFSTYFEVNEVRGVSVSSGVSDQPMSDEETLTGALNRVENARKEFDDADFWVGIEGGISISGKQIEAFAWVVVLSGEKTGRGTNNLFSVAGKGCGVNY